MNRIGHGVRALAGLFVLLAGCSKNSDGTTTGETSEKSLEQVCSELVATSCGVLSKCCQNGATFDHFECTRQQLDKCIADYDAQDVHKGVVHYNSDAAKACPSFSETSCPTFVGGVASLTAAENIACKSIISGFRPLGSGCTTSTQCAADTAGSYPLCFTGMPGGVCSKGLLSSDGSCGFFPDSYELRECGDGQQCVLSPLASVAPFEHGKAAFELNGMCQPLFIPGQVCHLDAPSPAQSSGGCAAGLVCAPLAGAANIGTCTAPHVVAESCSDNGLCMQGLLCNSATRTCLVDPSAIRTDDGAFCFQPAGSGVGAGGFSQGGTGGFNGVGPGGFAGSTVSPGGFGGVSGSDGCSGLESCCVGMINASTRQSCLAAVAKYSAMQNGNAFCSSLTQSYVQAGLCGGAVTPAPGAGGGSGAFGG